MIRIPFPPVVRSWGPGTGAPAPYPDDAQLPDPDDVLHRAVTIAAGSRLVWRWLCQLRVAPYSYDWLDNRGRTSPRHLVAGLDHVRVGQRVMTIFELTAFETGRHLTCSLTGHPLFGDVVCTYVVDPIGGPGNPKCRLRVRVRVRYPRALPASVLMPVVLPPGDLVMMRRQLLTLATLAERDERDERAAATRPSNSP